ncbi:MAG: DUF748 domain-containing protein [Candidatus Omnitrophota bacterium]|nr:DUF748 domain-containing protein [Candidatus Omnitrophota bacterium]
MKELIKILRIVIVIFVIVFAATFVFLLLQGKAILAGQIENLTHRKVTIDYVGLTLPFNLEMKNLEIPGLAKIDYTSISPSIPGLLSGKIVLNDLKLINPRIVYEKTQDKTQDKVNVEGVSANVNTMAVAPNPQLKSGLQLKSNTNLKSGPKKNRYLRLIIKRLNIKGGKIDFIDHTLPGEGIKITLKDINFHLTNLYIYPRSAITNFEFTGSIPWSQGQTEGKIEAKGWANLFKKDMQATVKVADIDGVYLYPYYSTWVDLEKTRIQSAKLNFTSNIKSVDNNLAAECHLELTDIVFKQRKEEGMDKAEKIAETVLGIFKALSQGKVIVNFTIKTKMTSPEFNFGYIKTAFEDRLMEGMKYSKVNYADILKIPVKSAGRTAADLSRAFIDGTYSLAKVFKDTLAYAFKKEK